MHLIKRIKEFKDFIDIFILNFVHSIKFKLSQGIK
jgi:hypothetical protein